MLSSTDQPLPVQPAPTTRDVWNRRLTFLRIILILVILVGTLFWFSSQIIVVLLIFLIAALLAYAIVPVIDLLHRFMPRFISLKELMFLLVVIASLILQPFGTSAGPCALVYPKI